MQCFKVSAKQWQVALTLLSLSCTPASAQAVNKCKLVQVADLPVMMHGHQPIIEGSINGKSAHFLLDTGAAFTSLFAPSAQRLGLHMVVAQGVTAYGAGGASTVMTTRLSDFGIDKFHVKDLKLMVLSHDLGGQEPIDGIVGEDLLSRTDLELNLAKGEARMISPIDCKGEDVVYWSGSYIVTPLLPYRNGDPALIEVKLNGARILAEVDSGAQSTVATLGAASAAGVTPTSSGVKRVEDGGGIGTHVITTYRAVFPTFTVGDETIKNVNIRLADLFHDVSQVPLGSRLAHPVDIDLPQMLLGADFLMSHRVYISRKQNAFYASYIGGPVFEDPTVSMSKAAAGAAR